MRLLPTAVLMAGALVLTGAHVEAQSLAEAAAKEKARRAQKAGKVFTEEDLRRAGSSGRASVLTGEPAGTTPAEGAPAEGAEGAPPADDAVGTATPKKAEKSSAELREERQKEWRGRLEKAQAELAAATAEVARIQTLMQGISPESTTALANFNARLTEQQNRAAAARQLIDTIETEGRQNGFR